MLKSYYVFEVRAYSSEALFKKIKEHHLQIEFLQKKEEYVYIVHVRYFEYRSFIKVFPYAKQVKRVGILFYFNRLLHKKLTVLSLIIGLFSFYYLNTLLYDIRFQGNNLVIQQQITEILKENKIAPKQKKPQKEKMEQAKEAILSSIYKIENIDFNLKGTILYVTYSLKEKNTVLTEEDGKYYAKKNGIIAYNDIVRGQALYEKNEYVKKGELIVEDTLYLNDKEIYVGAYGKVYAYTWSTVEYQYQTKNMEESEIYAKMVEDCRYQVAKEFTQDEKIEKEMILSFEYAKPISTIKIHYTLLENIAIH